MVLQNNYHQFVLSLSTRRLIAYLIVLNYLNRIKEITDDLGNKTTLKYDAYGNLIKTTDPLGNSAQMQYDSIGRLLKTTDPKGKSTSYAYDPMSRITEITDAINGKTKFAYDANGNLRTVTDAKNQKITYTYTVRDKVATMTDQLGKVETYLYDKMDNLISVKDRKNQTTTYTYDMLNRLTKTVIPAQAGIQSIEYSYDAVGRLTTIADTDTGMIEYVYSNTGCSSGCGGGAADKVMQEITSLGSINYEYDAIGRRTKMTVAGQPTVNYSYDSDSRLTGISGWGLGFGITYDALRRRTNLSLPNGITTTYNYDNVSNLLELVHQTPQQIIEKLVYSYDKNGNRTKMDRLNTPVNLPNPVSNTSYNQANEMLTFSDKNMTYDENGNMTSVTNACGTTTYTWDARNRLTGINGFNTDCLPLTASFNYDAVGRRIEKTINGKTINYLYDGLNIVQEIENGTVSVNYIRTRNIDEPLARIKTDETIRYYQLDALSSVIALTDETGAIKTQYSYDPFRNATISGEPSDNPFQYTGRENDGTGLYYYRARYYSPELQRFIAEDPIRLAGGINFFVYAKSNPIIFIDSLGLKWTLISFRKYWDPPIITAPHHGIEPDDIPNRVECIWEEKCGDKITTMGRCSPDKARNAYYNGTQFWINCCCPDPNKNLKEEYCRGFMCPLHSPEPEHVPEGPFLPSPLNPTPSGLPPVGGK